MKLRDLSIGALIGAGLCLGLSLLCPAPPDPNLKGAADHARDVVASTDSTLLPLAIAQRDSARSALAFALANRGSHHEAPLRPPAPPANATAPDSLSWCFRRIDYEQTIALNLARDTLRLGLVADSAIAAAQRFERASLTDSTRADSLRGELLARATDLDNAALTVGTLRRDLKRAYGTNIGAGASLAFAGEAFTSVVGPSVKMRKRILFVELEAEAIAGYGVGGNAATGETKAGPAGSVRMSVAF